MTIARKSIVTEAERRAYFKNQVQLGRRLSPEDARVAAETRKLGDKAKERIAALETWANGRQLTRGQ